MCHEMSIDFFGLLFKIYESYTKLGISKYRMLPPLPKTVCEDKTWVFANLLAVTGSVPRKDFAPPHPPLKSVQKTNCVQILILKLG